MNTNLLTKEVQDYINANLNADTNKIALGKSSFVNVSAAELATQITAKKKSKLKLPTWFNSENIYYPTVLSIEQTSSEQTADYKANLAKGTTLIDITAGFGVDSYYFSKKTKKVYSCEINEELCSISAHNAKILRANNITCLAENGLEFIQQTNIKFDNIYVDPARRNTSGKVFKLADCTPNIIEHLEELLKKTNRILIKTAPLLDITAGLTELKNVSEIHIVSVKNECKELIWVIDRNFGGEQKIVCATINSNIKTLTIPINELKTKATLLEESIKNYLYEPDVALMKSGAFNWIANHFGLQKLEIQSHLYTSNLIKPEFPGRIFEIKSIISTNELKKDKQLMGNVMVRNYPDKAENLVRKYKIRSSDTDFIIFTKNMNGLIVLSAKILQHY